MKIDKSQEEKIKCYTCLERTSDAHNANGYCSKHSTLGSGYLIDLCSYMEQHTCSRSIEKHHPLSLLQ